MLILEGWRNVFIFWYLEAWIAKKNGVNQWDCCFSSDYKQNLFQYVDEIDQEGVMPNSMHTYLGVNSNDSYSTAEQTGRGESHVWQNILIWTIATALALTSGITSRGRSRSGLFLTLQHWGGGTLCTLHRAPQASVWVNNTLGNYFQFYDKKPEMVSKYIFYSHRLGEPWRGLCGALLTPWRLALQRVKPSQPLQQHDPGACTIVFSCPLRGQR